MPGFNPLRLGSHRNFEQPLQHCCGEPIFPGNQGDLWRVHSDGRLDRYEGTP